MGKKYALNKTYFALAETQIGMLLLNLYENIRSSNGKVVRTALAERKTIPVKVKLPVQIENGTTVSHPI
jgi:hypothetical protein